MPGHDPGSKLARWRDQIAAAPTAADRFTAARDAVGAVARLIAPGDPTAADVLRDQAADLLTDLFERAAAALEAGNTGRPNRAAPPASPRRASQ